MSRKLQIILALVAGFFFDWLVYSFVFSLPERLKFKAVKFMITELRLDQGWKYFTSGDGLLLVGVYVGGSLLTFLILRRIFR